MSKFTASSCLTAKRLDHTAHRLVGGGGGEGTVAYSMGSRLNSGSSRPCLRPGHCIVFLGKNVYMETSRLMLRGNPAMDNSLLVLPGFKRSYVTNLSHFFDCLNYV